MNWQEVLEEIQSVKFDVNLNVVSGTNAFFRAVAREPAVLEAYRQMRESGELREDVLGRIHDLATLEIDPCYENPNDTPLAVLLWLTYFTTPNFAPTAAARIARAPQCWYARKLAGRILNPRPSTTRNYVIWETPGRPRATAVSSGNVRLTMTPTTEGSPKVYQGKPSVKSTTPVTMWEIPGEFTAIADN
jgi:hypothetical protein